MCVWKRGTGKYKLFYPKMERSVITSNRNIQEEKAPLGASELGLEMEEGCCRRGRTSIKSVNSGLGLEDNGEPWTAGGGTDRGIQRMENILPEEGVIRWQEPSGGWC